MKRESISLSGLPTPPSSSLAFQGLFWPSSLSLYAVAKNMPWEIGKGVLAFSCVNVVVDCSSKSLMTTLRSCSQKRGLPAPARRHEPWREASCTCQFLCEFPHVSAAWFPLVFYSKLILVMHGFEKLLLAPFFWLQPWGKRLPERLQFLFCTGDVSWESWVEH